MFLSGTTVEWELCTKHPLTTNLSVSFNIPPYSTGFVHITFSFAKRLVCTHSNEPRNDKYLDQPDHSPGQLSRLTTTWPKRQKPHLERKRHPQLPLIHGIATPAPTSCGPITLELPPHHLTMIQGRVRKKAHNVGIPPTRRRPIPTSPSFVFATKSSEFAKSAVQHVHIERPREGMQSYMWQNKTFKISPWPCCSPQLRLPIDSINQQLGNCRRTENIQRVTLVQKLNSTARIKLLVNPAPLARTLFSDVSTHIRPTSKTRVKPPWRREPLISSHE